jgi:hypothetical protein
MKDQEIRAIARVAHQVNRAYCLAIGDSSQHHWDDAPDWQQESAINGVKAHLENPRMTPEMSHEAWMADKEKAGWKYGPIKDVDKKEHPCFVPYKYLPVVQRTKDYLFASVVKALADHPPTG